ncbi:GIP, partial [Symbiodinium necroappetens]
MIQIRNRVFMLRASVVQGEVPLLMSRSALSKLGMVYDLEDHSAQFKHLGINKFSLMTTDSGHPAIPVTPKRVPGMKWPSPQQWANSEVIIVPMAESQYTAYMTSARGTSEGEVSAALEPPPPMPSRDEPKAPGHNLFYPKKINACVRNILCAEPLNDRLFATWWGGTPISKDFWIECEDSLVRVHVVPRKGLFDPSRWETPQFEVKDKLLGMIGMVRCTAAVSCSTLSSLSVVRDLWHEQSNASLPVLWVGRTVFSRVAARPPLYGIPPRVGPPRPPDGNSPAGEHLENEQDAAAVRGDEDEPNDPLLLVSRGTPPGHQRSSESFRGDLQCPQGSSINDSGTAEGSGDSTSDPYPCSGDKRAAADDDQGCRDAQQGGCGGDLREAPQQALPRGSGSVPGMGHAGGAGTLANYAKAKLAPNEESVHQGYNPEINSKVPLPSEDGGDSAWESHWSELTETAIQMNTRAAAKAASVSAMRAAALKKRSSGSGSQTENPAVMNQEIPKEVSEEIEALMTRLATLKADDQDAADDVKLSDGTKVIAFPSQSTPPVEYRSCLGSGPEDREQQLRPKKSIRKAIWKGAQRASQACVFEIGGTEVTYQMIEAGAHVIEPISWDEFFGNDIQLDAQSTIKITEISVLYDSAIFLRTMPIGKIARHLRYAGADPGVLKDILLKLSVVALRLLQDKHTGNKVLLSVMVFGIKKYCSASLMRSVVMVIHLHKLFSVKTLVLLKSYVQAMMRSRVKRGGYAVGELVSFYRIEKEGTGGFLSGVVVILLLKNICVLHHR